MDEMDRGKARSSLPETAWPIRNTGSQMAGSQGNGRFPRDRDEAAMSRNAVFRSAAKATAPLNSADPVESSEDRREQRLPDENGACCLGEVEVLLRLIQIDR